MGRLHSRQSPGEEVLEQAPAGHAEPGERVLVCTIKSGIADRMLATVTVPLEQPKATQNKTLVIRTGSMSNARVSTGIRAAKSRSNTSLTRPFPSLYAAVKSTPVTSSTTCKMKNHVVRHRKATKKDVYKGL